MFFLNIIILMILVTADNINAANANVLSFAKTIVPSVVFHKLKTNGKPPATRAAKSRYIDCMRCIITAQK